MLLAIAALPIKYGPVYLWPSVIFILAVTCLYLFLVLKGRTKIDADIKYWATTLSLLYLSLIIGSINNWVKYGSTIMDIKGILVDLFLPGIYLIWFLALLSQKKKLGFKRWAIFAFASPLIFTPSVLFPEQAKRLGFISPTNMFEGLLEGNTTLFATLLLIPFIMLTVLFVKESKWKQKLLHLAVITPTATLILWTGVRSAWFAAGLSAILIFLFELKHTEVKRPMFAITTLSMFAMISVTSFLMVPHDAQISILNRVFPQVTDYTYSQEIIKSTSLQEALAKIKENPKPSLPYQNRNLIWPQATKLLVGNPIGLGTQYHISSKAILQDGQVTVAHNLFLEAGLQGGLATLIIYLILIWKTISSIRYAKYKDAEWLILSLAFLSLFIIAFFDGHYLSTILLVSALILSLEQEKPGVAA